MGENDQRAGIYAARKRAASALFLLLGGMLLIRRFPSNTFSPTHLFALAALAALLAIPFNHRLIRTVALSLAVFSVGAAWWTIRISTPAHSLASLLQSRAYQTTILTVQGRILDRPDVSNTTRGELAPFIPYTPAARFRLAIHQILTDDGWIPVSGILRARISGIDGIDRGTIGSSRDAPGAGDLVTITGLAAPIPTAANPGQFDARQWAAQEGHAGTLLADNPALIALTPPGEQSLPSRIHRQLLAARATLIHTAQQTLISNPNDWLNPADPASLRRQEARALLRSLVLGLDDQREDQIQQRFTRLGIIHILAISGYHIVILTMLTGGLLRLATDPGRFESLAITLVILAYAIIVPSSAPVLRAVVCVLALLATRALGRRYDPICTLLWTASLLALWKPVDAFSLGYILSFGLCIALLMLAERTHRRLTRPRLRGLIPRRRTIITSTFDYLSRFSTATLLCWSISLPLIAWWTGIASPITLPASLILVPACSILLGAGLAAMLLGTLASLLAPELSAPISQSFAGFLEQFAAIILRLADFFDQLPLSSLRIPPLGLPWMLAATLTLIYWFTRGHLRDVRAWLATAAVIIWLAISATTSWHSQGLPPRTTLTADALAVGDGDSTLIRARTDDRTTAILIDAGSTQPGLGLRLIPETIRNLGCWRIPTAIILGKSPRCFSSLPDIARAVDLQQTFMPQSLLDEAKLDPGGIHAAFLRALEARGIAITPIDPGDRLPISDTLAIEFDQGAEDLRARIINIADASTHLLITHDAPATPITTDTVLAAANAATENGLAQLLRETHARFYICSNQHPPYSAEPEDPTILHTSTHGHIRLRWTTDGQLSITSHR
ncbi:MAG: ComEC/Rec2 family competence protein [Phycisphaerales bacterium]|nr:ComEC/Rec2 family competence protein [Phycisphaerales bacterium]